MKNKTVLITGATSGIGLATAKIFAKHKANLIICGRRESRLQSLSNELSAITKVHFLCFDVGDKGQVFNAINSLPEAFSNIDILINNAGNAHGLEPFHEANIDDWDAMINSNVKGLLYVSKAVAPKMVKQKSGHIINVGSIAGKEVYPKGNVYCATKHAVDAINKAMRIDLHTYGIKVGAVNPGLVETEFSMVRFKGDKERAAQVYKGYKALNPEDVANIIYFMTTLPPHVNIADLVVVPTDQANSYLVNKNQ